MTVCSRVCVAWVIANGATPIPGARNLKQVRVRVRDRVRVKVRVRVWVTVRVRVTVRGRVCF